MVKKKATETPDQESAPQDAQAPRPELQDTPPVSPSEDILSVQPAESQDVLPAPAEPTVEPAVAPEPVPEPAQPAQPSQPQAQPQYAAQPQTPYADQGQQAQYAPQSQPYYDAQPNPQYVPQQQYPYAPQSGPQYQQTPQQAQQPYGYQQPPQQPYGYQQPYVNPDDVKTTDKDRIIAGLLGIFLGSLGIHKFYLGYRNEGLIMLLVTIIGSCFTLGFAAAVMGIIGLIEGILYLTKSQREFEQTYVYHRKGWF
jgi:TM2 domain-containing membrane protein YozV